MFKKIEFESNARIIVISDIHGELRLFKELLDKVSYNVNDDYLIILGDIIEKGNDSLATLHFVMELAKNPKVIVLKGNCEQILGYCEQSQATLEEGLNYLSKQGGSIILDKAKQMNIEITNTLQLSYVLNSLNIEKRFIEDLPVALFSEKLIFVHAGIKSFDDVDIRYLLSTRTFLEDGHSFEQYVIVGHYPTKNYSTNVLNYNPYFDFDKRIICIDGGNVVSNGQLNALIINNVNDYLSFTYRSASCFERKLFTNNVVGNEKKLCNIIVYPNYEVKLIQKGQKQSLVELNNAKRLLVKNQYLNEKDDKCYATIDYTEFYHTIDKPTLGYIVLEDDSDYLVNINGIYGWIAKIKDEINF